MYDTARFDGGGTSVPANAVAAVFDIYDRLDQASLDQAYARLGAVKLLEKDEPTTPPSGMAPTNITMAGLFCRDSELSVETIAEELDHLTRSRSFRQWPDIAIVLTRGTVNFTIQFPGEHVMGDFLPPSQGDFLIIPAYIHLLVRPGGPFTLNRLLWILLTHLGTFTGEGPFPPKEVVEVHLRLA